MKQAEPGLQVRGIGGEELSRAGMELLYNARDLSVVGILEVAAHAPHIVRAYRAVKRELAGPSPPALVLLIDYPDFNLRIARLAKKHSVPVLYYISPQIWAWRRGRAKKISRTVDTMAVIFPFEADLYRKEGLDVHFVGHPLLDTEPRKMPRSDALDFLGLEDTWPVIGILPGSRPGEIQRLLPAMLGAAGRIRTRYPDARFVLPLAQGLDTVAVNSTIRRAGVPVQVVSRSFYQALSACDLALVASGTATLETALMETPMIILYRISLPTYLIGRMLIRVPCIGLANIVAGKKVVPELIQADVTPEKIAGEALSMLADPKRMQAIRSELAAVRASLGDRGAAERVARLACSKLRGI